MKLTIDNYKRIENSFNWATWGVQSTEETHTQYYFELRNSYGSVLDVMLERDPTYGDSKTQYQYQFWCSGRNQTNSPATTCTEYLYFHQVKDKRLFSSALAAIIRKWTNG